MVATDHLVTYEERVCRHPLGRRGGGLPVGATGGWPPRPGWRARGREIYDVWRLGTEPEPRYRLEVLFDSYAASAKEAMARPPAG